MLIYQTSRSELADDKMAAMKVDLFFVEMKVDLFFVEELAKYLHMI